MPQEEHEPTDKPTSWREFPVLLIKGFLMGSADIVPGVSGGTMALIVGIYSRLIHAIKSFDTSFLKNLFALRIKDALSASQWKFMVMLLAGIFSAVLFFTKVVPLQVYMFSDPELIFGLFFGLIIGSVVILAKALDSFSWQLSGFILIGSLIGFWIVTLVPTETPESPLFVFFSGSIAICAMILPGISGSYILLILQKYDFVLAQVSKLGTSDTPEGLLVLAPFVIGAIVGLALFSRFLSWLLDHHYQKTLAVLIGFLIGSLYVIWPYQDRDYAEFVTHKQVIAYDHSRAVELRNTPLNENRPEFERLGETIYSSGKNGKPEAVELLKVKKKLVQSDPYVPYVTKAEAGTPHFWDGLLGMLIGLFMVIGLDYLRDMD